MPEMQHYDYKAERKTAGVVLIGNFNALLFHPLWFLKHGVFGQDEMDDVLRRKDEMICAPGLTSFHTSHILVKVEDYRFEISALKEPFGTVIDACKKVFENLETIAITAMGINTTAHYKMPDLSTFHKLGDLLAPKERWSAFLGSDVSGDDRRGGLASLVMMRQKSDKKGSRSIKVERSRAFSLPAVGIFINCNDHYAFESTGGVGIDASEVMEILADNFSKTIDDFASFQNALFKDL